MFKVKIKYLILMSVAFAFAYLQGGNLPYSVFYGFAITFIVGLFLILMHRKKLFVDVKLDKKIYFSGENVFVSMVIQNNTLFPVPFIKIINKAISIVNNKYFGDVINLKMDESKWIKHQLQFKRRGIYNFGDITVSLKDMFSIFETDKYLKRRATIRVYPRIYEIEKSLLKGSDIFKNARSNKSSIEDMYSTRDIRKYRDGDNLKRINWKVSAKLNELYVRNFETVSGQEFNIFLDMSVRNYEVDNKGIFEELLIDFCSSLLSFMIHREIKTKLFVNASRVQSFEIENKTDFDKLMDYFLTQDSDAKLSFLKFINGHVNKISSLSGIGIITSSVDDNFTDALMSVKDSGNNIILFYSGGAWEEIKNIQLLCKVGIDCFNIDNMIANSSKPGIG